MRFTERVAVQAPTRTEGETGEVLDAFADIAGYESVPARVVADTRELLETHLTIVEQRYRVLLGARVDVDTGWRVVRADGTAYDIVEAQPPLREVTVLTVRRTDPGL